jgi:single-strand DNA-binding protein
MANFNKVILAGNLTRDPELRYTPKGTAIARIGLAINRRFAGEDGQPREETTFVDVDAFGKQAETIGQYLRKGRPILIEGRLRLDQWDDKQTGQKRSKLGVVMESFQFLDAKAGGDGIPAPVGGPAPRPSRPAPSSQATEIPYSDAPPQDDDVPF